MITLVLADDHQVVRQGLRSLLETEPAFQVVGEAADGLETVGSLRCLQPDILVLDLMMPGLSGLEVVRQAGKVSPSTRVVVLSMHADEAYVLEALKNGVAGYVLKDAPIDELVRAVREAVAGRRYLCPPLSERAIDAYLQSTRTDELDPYDTLTLREREVLHLAVKGGTNSSMASQLSISRRTVETHRASLMRKLGLQSQADLIRFALNRGILPSE